MAITSPPFHCRSADGLQGRPLDNYGLVTLDSNLIYLVIDVLLGGRRGQGQIRAEGRPYTTIEINLVKRMFDIVLGDAEIAFQPGLAVKFTTDRIETNPRFASISRPPNAAILIDLHLDLEGRGGRVEILLPYARSSRSATCSSSPIW